MAPKQKQIAFKSRKVKLHKALGNENDVTEKCKTNTLKRGRGQPLNVNTETNKVLPDDEFCSHTKLSRLTEGKRVEGLAEVSDDTAIELPGREKELEWIRAYVREHVDNEKPGALYVCGMPGTGKTACLTHVFASPEFSGMLKYVYINCTMVRSAGAIYRRLCDELRLQSVSGAGVDACHRALRKHVTRKNSKMTVLVLDEIDQLDSKKQEVLYSLFELPALPRARLLLVGVANALDLTQRALPRLHDAAVQQLHFAPYTAGQIVDIFRNRLARQDCKDMFSPIVMQFLAAKIAALSGDIRKALDTVQRLVELARRHRHSSQGTTSDKQQHNTAIDINKVAGVLEEVYGDGGRFEAQVEEEGFPVQQKLVVCALLLLLTAGRDRAHNTTHKTTTTAPMGKLYDIYKKACQQWCVESVGWSEFGSVCALVEARGLVRGARGSALGRAGAAGASSRRAQLALAVDAAALSACLAPRDHLLLRALQNDPALHASH